MRDDDEQGQDDSGSSAASFKQSQSAAFNNKTPDIISANRTTKLSSSSGASPSNHSSRWKPVLLPLDPDFLRLTNDECCDEFAVMLQNEEFLAELRWERFFDCQLYALTCSWISHSTDSTKSFFLHSTAKLPLSTAHLTRKSSTWEKFPEKSSNN